jgi:beta-phosphoglucomutase-like phosphatase (HAD superfamily)
MGMIIVPEYIKGLIFDCDGTLVDSMPMHMKAWEHAITSAGAPWHYDFIFSRKGMSSKGVVDLYNKELGTSLDIETVSKIKQSFFRQHHSGTKPIDAVVDVARRYHGVLPMAVASGGSRENVNSQLEVIGIRNLFDVILTADDDVEPKPSPQIFLEAAKRIGVSPELCQVFEDGDLGLEAAHRIGMLATDIRIFQ